MGDADFSPADFAFIHLWVEGFFGLFVTVMVAIIFYRMGVVSQVTASRVVNLDAILYLGSGIVGTGHHWYWTGQSNITMALAAVFSAMEVVPLTLLTLDAWDFAKLTHSKAGATARRSKMSQNTSPRANMICQARPRSRYAQP